MFYGFFSAALPTLEFGVVPEITLEEFDLQTGRIMSKKRHMELLSWDDETQTLPVAVYRKMREFDDFLKFRIAEKRQEKLGVSVELPEISDSDSDVDFYLPAAAAASDPLERERLVDLIRWRKIDELESEHQLDFTALCCYRLRLVALEKFRKRSNESGSAVFEQAVDKLALQISNM